MDRLSTTLKEMDGKQDAFELKSLTFERKMYAEEQRRYHQKRQICIADNKRERAKTKQECEDCDGLELQKFNLMMEVLQNKEKWVSLVCSLHTLPDRVDDI